MAPRSRAILAIAIAVALVACGKDEPIRKEEAQGAAAKAPAKVEIVTAPETADVAAVVQAEVARARADGRDLVVYVGAHWCEPCMRFHDAAKAGELDATLPGLRLLEFDLDRDREALARAGYASRMIPLFAAPRADGTGSGEQIEGSIKGDGAVPQITPRLAALIRKARAAR